MLVVNGFMREGTGIGNFASQMFQTVATIMHMEREHRVTLEEIKNERKEHITKSWSKVMKCSLQRVPRGQVKRMYCDLNYSVSHQGTSRGKQDQFKKFQNRLMGKQNWPIRLPIRFVRNLERSTEKQFYSCGVCGTKKWKWLLV